MGVATIACPRRIWHSTVRQGRMTWPLTRSLQTKARCVPAEALGGFLTAQTSTSDIPLARRETGSQQKGTEFRDEVDAYVEQERRDWLEELV
jgi:hypothetical protein